MKLKPNFLINFFKSNLDYMIFIRVVSKKKCMQLEYKGYNQNRPNPSCSTLDNNNLWD
jgi:hypothetical protein